MSSLRQDDKIKRKINLNRKIMGQNGKKQAHNIVTQEHIKNHKLRNKVLSDLNNIIGILYRKYFISCTDV